MSDDKPKKGRPGPKPRVDKATVAKALRLHAGNMSAAARQLKVSRVTVFKYVRRSKELQDLVAELTEETLDLSESQLLKLIKNPRAKGHTQAVIFHLKTRGRTRGYTERTEVTGPPPADATAGPVRVYLPQIDPEE